MDTGNTQADELFNSFLEKVSVLTTEDYAYFFEVNDYEGLTNFYASRYVMHCNGTEEEWKNKEPFEQYLWDAFYVTPLEALAVYSWDEVMGDSEEEEPEDEESEDETSDSKIPGGLIFGVLGVLVVAIIGVVIYLKFKGKNKKAA